ncbi:MAG: hypothetical protein MJ180_01425 [Candidatus Gastranaerophilales bacterium]|nr:hypothetical protein [Candidatus Gastranaerophilales bacterium]
MKKESIITLFTLCLLSVGNITFATNIQDEAKIYDKVTSEEKIIDALDTMKGTVGEYSRNAILGENISERPIKVEFKDLATIKPQYANYDALGLKKGKQLYIYVNLKHHNAPKEAIAALLSHEALHQDEYNSINEETYAWTMEATVWADLCKRNPVLRNNKYSSLASRENILLKMLENANYSNILIKNTVVNHPGYQTLPQKSPGFEK